ncbi:MAG: DUF6456 domain-containing protein [Hyphomicrobiaceae bacterium]
MNSKSTGMGGRAVVRLLKALARAHAFAEIERQEPDKPRVRVYCGADASGTTDVTHHAAWDVWQRAQSAGLVECHGEGETARWSISALGRERLKGCAGDTRSANLNDRVQVPVAEAVRLGPSRARIGPLDSASESPLTWLYKRRDKTGATLISQTQFEAGERLRFDFEIAQLMPRVTIDWARAATGCSRTSARAHHGLELGERALAARERVSRALTAVGPELASVLIDVCCHLKGLEQLERAAGWPQRSAKIILQVALSALARHYGLERSGREDAQRDDGPARVLHWGADGYRPETVVVPGETDGT